MIDIPHSLALVAIVAIVTLALRAAPFVIFGIRRQTPAWTVYLSRCLPPAIMATLVVYCLRGIDFLAAGHGIPEIAATAIAIILHKWRKNILLTVSVSTICHMYLRTFS